MRKSLVAWVCVMAVVVVVGWGGWGGVVWGQASQPLVVRGAMGKVTAEVEPIVRTGGVGGGKVKLVEFDQPGMAPGMYVVTARMRASGAGGGVVRVTSWNVFGGQAYFSKSEKGVLVSEGGEWVKVELPFVPGEGMVPERVWLEAEIPEGVRVEVQGVLLSSLGNGGAFGVLGQWWSVREGAMVGAVLGSGVGVVGAVVGMLAARGRGRRWVMGLIAGVMGMGVVCLVAGIVAVVMKQPYHVYYPLLLVGVLGTVIMGVALPRVRGGYQVEEQRRMQAVDL